MGVNYIWDLLIKSADNGMRKQQIQFTPAVSYSPYMELSYEMLNTRTIDPIVEVNPYYRYYAIFKELFPADHHEDEEFKHHLFDLVLHFLAEIDLLQGMNKREYHLQFVLKDIELGLFGKRIQSHMRLLPKVEREQIASNILRMYRTGDEIYLLRDTMRNLFKDCMIYAKSDGEDELLIYLAQEECEALKLKVALILEIFLPIRFQAKIYWKQHFGIMGADETMKLDQIALY